MLSNPILEINNLSVEIEGKLILQDFNLTIESGKIHALMGPNGSGKSTLANLIARKPGMLVTQGSIRYQDEDLLTLSPEICASKGIFLSFQYPVAIPGVTNIQFLKTACNALRKAQGHPPIDAIDFLTLVKEKIAHLSMSESLLYRAVNDGFSGGEKKLNEILQMSLFNPTLAILDEIDSGLDIDALKAVAKGINALRNPNHAMILITHYQRLLDYIEPDYVHIMSHGQLVKSGNKSLATELEQEGYALLEGIS